MERFSARHEKLEERETRRKVAELPGCAHHMLKVVDKDQGPLSGQVEADVILCLDGLRDCELDEPRIVQRLERNPKDAVGKIWSGLSSHLERQPCLAASACARQRQ